MDPTEHWAGIRASHRHGPVWVIELVGDFDYSNLNDIAEATAHALRAHPGPLVFDMAALTFCDSSLLNHLLRVRAERRVMLTQVPDQARRLFEVTGTSDHLEEHKDVREAVDSVDPADQ
ncbi:STAS domain-containing protein [Streptomyces sp. YJ-C3]